MKSLIAILTDYGLRDGFVGALKGVTLSINPEVQIVDLSHQVRPFDILEGALILKAHYSYFPKGTVFLCVVDPGVGSERMPVAIRSGNYFFVGPNNGIFDLALRSMGKQIECYRIERFTLPRVNETFHGRDVFAPVAAHISKGLPINEVGNPVSYTYILDWKEPKEDGDVLWGEVVYIDHFGNCVTNLPCGRYVEAYFRDMTIRVVPYFLKAEKGEPAMVCGSFGFMEVFLPMDNLHEKFKVLKGERVGVKKV